MAASAAATALAVLHLGFIAFVVVGGLLILRWPRVMWLHVPAAVWGALIELGGWYCPLTTWENSLLREAGRAGYQNGFIAHYLFAAIYPEGLTRTMQIALGALVLAINAAVYIAAWRRYRPYRRPMRSVRG